MLGTGKFVANGKGVAKLTTHWLRSTQQAIGNRHQAGAKTRSWLHLVEFAHILKASVHPILDIGVSARGVDPYRHLRYGAQKRSTEYEAKKLLALEGAVR